MVVQKSPELVHRYIPLRNTIRRLEGFVDVERRPPVHPLSQVLCFLFQLEVHIPHLAQLEACLPGEVVLASMHVSGVEGLSISHQLRVLSILRRECLAEVRVAQSAVIVVVVTAEE